MKFWEQTNSGNQLYNKTKLIDVLNKKFEFRSQLQQI